MRTRNMVVVMSFFLQGSFMGLSSAAIVTDPPGDTFGTGPTDIIAAQAEQLAPIPGVDVLKVSYTATPNLGGIMIFEADVDSSTGTGGVVSITGNPVSPCPCKTTPGIDVAIVAINRDQAESSSMGMCAGLPNARSRKFGEYFAMASGLEIIDPVGILRGYSDPVPIFGNTKWSYTFPWALILAIVHSEAQTVGEGFDYVDAIDPTTTRWQLSVWTDPNYAVDHDDFADGSIYLNVSDVIPNGNGVLVSSVDVGTHLTFCEGNFDFDQDVDGTDAAKFKSDFGRNPLFMGCRTGANYFY